MPAYICIHFNLPRFSASFRLVCWLVLRPLESQSLPSLVGQLRALCLLFYGTLGVVAFITVLRCVEDANFIHLQFSFPTAKLFPLGFQPLRPLVTLVGIRMILTPYLVSPRNLVSGIINRNSTRSVG